MSTPVSEPVDPTAYGREVRRSLSDLPPALIEELLEDLDEHLAEVAAEVDGPLEGRLGSPASYAQELRRAAGLPASTAPRAPARFEELRAAAGRIGEHDAVRSGLAFLPELRPAWWVLRAWLALLAVGWVFGSGFAFPFPAASVPGALLWLPLVVAAVVVSVRLGRRARRLDELNPRRRLVTVGGNAFLALVAVIAMVAVQQRSEPVYADQSFPSGNGFGYAYGPGGTLAHEDGSPITNIYPYSSSGEPLSDVLLYDQDGRALDNVAASTPDGLTVSRVVPLGSPPPPANAYPQQQRVTAYDERGDITHEPLGPLPSPVLPSSTSTPGITTAPSPSATPSATPAATPSPAASASPSPTPSSTATASPTGTPR